MKIHRFYIDQEIREGTLTITEQGFVNQVKNVLRFKPGDVLEIFGHDLKEARATITSLHPSSATLSIEKVEKSNKEPEREAHLYAALLKRENFEFIVQKATEIGIREIHPITTLRTVKLGFNLERLSKIAQEAAEQSGRILVPTIHEPVSFEEAIGETTRYEKNYFFDQGGKTFQNTPVAQNSCSLFIGPEGGWDPSEQEKAIEAKLEHVSLSNLTLRAETAAILASYAIISAS